MACCALFSAGSESDRCGLKFRIAVLASKRGTLMLRGRELNPCAEPSAAANVVVWPKLFERSRRVVLGSSMMAINGRIQREGEIVHLIGQQLFDLTGDLSSLSERDEAFRLPTGRGDEF